MWYIFPQIEGLGRSSTSKYYSIKSKEEAKAYLEHPVLGTRLIECAAILLGLEGKTAHEIFDSPDDCELRSCMTLFASISKKDSVFHRVLKKYFQGIPDFFTLTILTGKTILGDKIFD